MPDERGAEAGPLRRCIVTGEVRPKAELLRFVVGPDGAVVPDLGGAAARTGFVVDAAARYSRRGGRQERSSPRRREAR